MTAGACEALGGVNAEEVLPTLPASPSELTGCCAGESLEPLVGVLCAGSLEDVTCTGALDDVACACSFEDAAGAGLLEVPGCPGSFEVVA